MMMATAAPVSAITNFGASLPVAIWKIVRIARKERLEQD